jgi:hypothetical protein
MLSFSFGCLMDLPNATVAALGQIGRRKLLNASKTIRAQMSSDQAHNYTTTPFKGQ